MGSLMITRGCWWPSPSLVAWWAAPPSSSPKEPPQPKTAPWRHVDAQVLVPYALLPSFSKLWSAQQLVWWSNYPREGAICIWKCHTWKGKRSAEFLLLRQARECIALRVNTFPGSVKALFLLSLQVNDNKALNLMANGALTTNKDR